MSFGPERDAARMYPDLQNSPYDDPSPHHSRKSSMYASIPKDGSVPKKVTFDDKRPDSIPDVTSKRTEDTSKMTSRHPPEVPPREVTKHVNTGIYPNIDSRPETEIPPVSQVDKNFMIETEVPPPANFENLSLPPPPGGVENLGFASDDVVMPSAPPASRPESEVSDVMQFGDEDSLHDDLGGPNEVKFGALKVMGTEVDANGTSTSGDLVTAI